MLKRTRIAFVHNMLQVRPINPFTVIHHAWFKYILFFFVFSCVYPGPVCKPTPCVDTAFLHR